MAQVFGEDKVARKFKTVSLSHQAIARRVSDLGKHVSLKQEYNRKLHIFFIGTGWEYEYK